MRVEATSLPDVQLITPVRHGDERGFFSETYVEGRYVAAGITDRFVQGQPRNVSGARHRPRPALADRRQRAGKACPRDARRDLRRRGRYPSLLADLRQMGSGSELSAANWQQLYVPIGFAHGYCTLEPRDEVLYKTSAVYDREAERAVRWDDPAIGITWPAVADPGASIRKRPNLATTGRRIGPVLMRVLVTGADGQVGTGRCNGAAWPRGVELSVQRRATLDIADADAVTAAVATLQPDLIVNAAAYTDVDRAESEAAQAAAANRDGPANLARACAGTRCRTAAHLDRLCL